MNKHKVSIICPIYNEEQYIGKFIMSILAQDYPQESLEVFFVDGGSTDKTIEILKRYISERHNMSLLDNPQHTVPYALNKGIAQSMGDIVVRIDAHCIYPSDYITTLVKYLHELDADNVGAVWHTVPAKDTAVCHAIAIASSHPFGVGDSKHKIGTKQIMRVDTVPFGCYRRDVFDRIGLFDTELTRNQDDEFNARLINHGGSIYLIPQLVINYTARDTIGKMCRMYYQYGLFKPLVNKKLGHPATIRQFFPMLFLLGIIFGGILSFFSNIILWMYTAVLALYILIGMTIGCKYATKLKRPILTVLMPYVFANVHLSYGYGYLRGIYKILANKKFNVESNR